MENDRRPPAGGINSSAEAGRGIPPAAKEKAVALSTGDYVVLLILFSLPLVNIVLAFVWAFSGGVNPNRKNFAKAYLIMFAAFSVLAGIAGAAVYIAVREFMPEVVRLF